jgi:hypothetical protein
MIEKPGSSSNTFSKLKVEINISFNRAISSGILRATLKNATLASSSFSHFARFRALSASLRTSRHPSQRNSSRGSISAEP